MINWIGSFGQGSGYSGASEKICIALEDLGVDVRVMSFGKDNERNFTENGREIRRKPFAMSDVGIVFGFPNAFDSAMNYKYKIGFTMFETDKLPNGVNDWAGKTGNAADAINKMDLLLVPCEHNKELFRREGVKIPIEVVHLGIDPLDYVIMDRPQRKKFVFYSCGVLTIRKNPGALISAFLDLFKDNPDVELVLKTNSGTLGHITFPYGNLKVIDRLATPEEMFILYRDADCFVFPSRGEGFGLTPLEAMATGLPTIFGNNTGMSEYANDKYNYPVSCPTMSKAIRFPKRWGDVGNWYEVDYNELKEKMLYVYNHRKEAHDLGLRAGKWVRESWTYQHTAKRIKSLVEDLISGKIKN